MIDVLEQNPDSGTHLGKNLYKVRMAISSKGKGKGKGKSGGARVITYVMIKKDSVYLAAIYDKSEQSTIDTDRLLKVLKSLDL